MPEHARGTARDVGTRNRAYEGPGVDALVRELSTVLANPGHPAHAPVRLRQCDRLFGELDAHMRRGGPAPVSWRVAPGALPAWVCVAACYGALSETLRERVGVTAARRVLVDAARWWESLDEALRSGGPLPEPWKRDV